MNQSSKENQLQVPNTGASSSQQRPSSSYSNASNRSLTNRSNPPSMTGIQDPSKEENQPFVSNPERLKHNFVTTVGGESFPADEYFDRLLLMKNRLHSIISTMDTKVEKIMHHHEEEYVKAFKFYIRGVHKELESMRDKTDEVQLKYLRDEKILRLENSLDDAQVEFKKLYESFQASQKDLTKAKREIDKLQREKKYMQSKIDSPSKDENEMKRGYRSLLTEISLLKSQIKTLEKQLASYQNRNFTQNKIERKVKQLHTSMEHETIEQEDNHPETTKKMPKLNDVDSSLLSGNTALLSKHSSDLPEAANTRIWRASESPSVNNRGTTLPSRAVKSNQHDIAPHGANEQSVEKLKRQLQRERKEKLKLSNYISTRLEQRKDYEQIFAGCVEHVRRLSEYRKVCNKPVNASSHPRNYQLLHKAAAEQRDWKSLLATEKQSILETFVSDQKILRAIYLQIFPPRQHPAEESSIIRDSLDTSVDLNRSAFGQNESPHRQSPFMRTVDHWTMGAPLPFQVERENLVNRSVVINEPERARTRSNNTSQKRRYCVQNGKILAK